MANKVNFLLLSKMNPPKKLSLGILESQQAKGSCLQLFFQTIWSIFDLYFILLIPNAFFTMDIYF